VKKIFEIKKRPENMAISVAVPHMEGMEEIAQVNQIARRICEIFLPGPLTLLLKKTPKVPDILTGGSDMVGVRIPDHPFALNMLDILGPITCTSANLHGQEGPKVSTTAQEQLGDKISYYFDCGPCRFQKPSTIIDVSKGTIKIVREGVIPESLIRRKIT
jgi:L-threonylcarbamoyladenylate synthase